MNLTPPPPGQPKPAPRCPICESIQAIALGKWTHGYDRLRCSDCGLFFADPFENTSNMYSHEYASEGAYNFALDVARNVKAGKKSLGWPYQVLLKHLKGMGIKGSLFEVGCGSGYFIYYMQRQGWKALGCDVDATAVQAAKEILNVDVIHTDFNASIAEDGSLDVLVAFEVIEHLKNPVGFLKLASVKLKKGGYLYLSTPNASTKWPTHWRKERTVLPPFHLTVFSEQPLQRASEKAGFEVVEFVQKPVPYRYEFMEEGYSKPRLFFETFKAFLQGIKGVTILAVLRNKGIGFSANRGSNAASAP